MANKASKSNVKKLTAMERLLKEGFFDSKEAALPFLMSGAVYCGGTKVLNGGQKVDPALPMYVRGLDERYVGKGGYKLEGALKDFGVNAEGRICIDAGACTGGFTDCLVQKGAKTVYAVEVGFGQLAGKLQQNPAVVNLEKTNLGDEKLLSLDPRPDLGSMDLSYLSIEKAAPLYRAIMGGKGEVLCLVKPLFEVEDAEARRTGEIRPDQYLPVLEKLIAVLNSQEGTSVRNVTYSPVTGNNGTHEFFLHVVFGDDSPAPDLAEKAAACVEKVLSLPRYHKG
ncbi:MAG: TlyA family rRNA (cytidine-2'-O)-methyltransferase [Clostridiales bacterium]|nr:TlyA family rRNA (cytidine-2'-O)-methyltransferase [Clostridiales bacterium]